MSDDKSNKKEELYKKLADNNLNTVFESVIAHFEAQSKKYYGKHKLTRRLGLIGFIALVMGSLMLAIEAIAGKTTLVFFSFNTANTLDSCLAAIFTFISPSASTSGTLCVFGFIVIVCMIHKLCNILQDSLIFLVGFSWLSSLFYLNQTHLMLFWGGLLVTVTYVINRKQGFTRGWSRNRLTMQKLQLLSACRNSKLIDTETDCRRTLLELLNENNIQTHSDIVEDYIDYGKSAFSWLPKKK